jgi:DNA polymerase-1
MQLNLFDIDAKTPGLYDVILIDGNHLLHRAMGSYSGLGFIDEKRNKFIPTGAIYGFLNMVMSTYRRWSDPQGCRLIVCWEGGATVRKEMYPDYKGNRKLDKDKLTEEEVASKELYKQEMFLQLRTIEKMISLLGWEYCRVEGWEADDAMGSLAKTFSTQDRDTRVCIYTGDGDLHQCVTPNVHVVSGGSGKQKDTVYKLSDVQSKWGVHPTMIPQLKGLAGDSGDNIPGCPSCGQKTAANLLTEHGSVEAILDLAVQGTLPKFRNSTKIQANLVENQDLVQLCVKLAVINQDLEVNIQKDNPDLGTVQQLLEYFQIRQFNAGDLVIF